MRFAIIVVAALVSLGLAAFGIVSAQKTAGLASSTTPYIRIASLAQSIPALLHAPVKQIAQTRTADTAPATAQPPTAAEQPASPIEPARVAQTTPAPAGAAASTQAANTQAANTPAASAPAAGTSGAAVASATPNNAPMPMNDIPACDKPGGMGLSRIVEIDTTGGPGFGFEHFKQYDFLRDKEIVLTFDDGPWPENTPAVLKALADNCLKATFFEIGEHAMWHPEITKEVIAAGMTVGTHTWSHKDLARNPYASDLDLAKQEIEMGISAVHAAADSPICNIRRRCWPISPSATSRRSRPTSTRSISRCTSPSW